MNTLPPEATVDTPAVMEIAPPVPLFPEPTRMEILPPRPLLALPVAIRIEPLLPDVLTPELKTRLPDTPEEPAAAVAIKISPELDVVLPPL